MPKAGYRKRHREPGSQEERDFLLKKIGFTKDRKAILLAAALDSVAAGLGLGPVTDSPPSDGPTIPLEQRLRAAGMVFNVLGTKPSRNPMAAALSPSAPTDEGGDPGWMEPEPVAQQGGRPSLRGSIEVLDLGAVDGEPAGF